MSRDNTYSKFSHLFLSFEVSTAEKTLLNCYLFVLLVVSTGCPYVVAPQSTPHPPIKLETVKVARSAIYAGWLGQARRGWEMDKGNHIFTRYPESRLILDARIQAQYVEVKIIY